MPTDDQERRDVPEPTNQGKPWERPVPMPTDINAGFEKTSNEHYGAEDWREEVIRRMEQNLRRKNRDDQ